MMKTLKKSEVEILFEKNFLNDYYYHIKNHENSLLMKIFGVYEIQVKNQNAIYFLITENMIGQDFKAIKRCFDLKGSLYDR